MTKRVAFLVDNGFEELELVAPLDILRRAGLDVDLISANNNLEVTGSHNIVLLADKKISDVENILDYDGLIIPGGMPGSSNLRDNDTVIKFYKEMYLANKLVSAICAAPIVLNQAGITKNKKITCYPSFEEQITYKEHSKEEAVVVDGNVITAQGPAVAMLFGLKIVEYLLGKEASENVANPMLVDVLKNNL